MKSLNEILTDEKEHHTIANLAKDLGFRDNNIRLFFMSWTRPDSLNLIVEVEDDAIGNSNYAYILEVKLIQYYGVDVVVITQAKASKEIENSSFSLENSELEIKKFFNLELDHILLKDPDIDDFDLEIALANADEIISEVKRLKLSKASSMMFDPQQASSTTSIDNKESIPSGVIDNTEPSIEISNSHHTVPQSTSSTMDEFLSPDNRKVVEATLQALPSAVLDTVFTVFTAKKRQLNDETVSEKKLLKTDQASDMGESVSPNTPRISVR